MKLYVGNLASTIIDTQLQSLFSEHGSVDSVKVMRDQNSGQPRGFGFVEIADVEAKRVRELLNGKDIEGRPLKVIEARPTRQQEDRAADFRGGTIRLGRIASSLRLAPSSE